jgi:signal transduction histidine kinase
MSDQQDSSFARLVSLACHDLRTPLATVNGFARTIQRTEELGNPLGRYVEMIVAASAQMTDLLEAVSLVARIEAGRFEPLLAEADTLDLARAAAEELDGVRAEGKGETIETDGAAATSALGAFALCAQRHGPAGTVTLRAQGREVIVGPVTAAAAPVIMGEELKDLGAAVALRAVRALGGDACLADGELHVTFG